MPEKQKRAGGKVIGLKMRGFGVVGWPANGEPAAKKSAPEELDPTKQPSEKETDMSNPATPTFMERLKSWALAQPDAPADLKGDPAPAVPPAAAAVTPPAEVKSAPPATPPGVTLEDVDTRIKSALDERLAPIEKGQTEMMGGMEFLAKSMGEGFNKLTESVDSIKNYRSSGNDLGGQGAQPQGHARAKGIPGANGSAGARALLNDPEKKAHMQKVLAGEHNEVQRDPAIVKAIWGNSPIADVARKHKLRF